MVQSEESNLTPISVLGNCDGFRIVLTGLCAFSAAAENARKVV